MKLIATSWVLLHALGLVQVIWCHIPEGSHRRVESLDEIMLDLTPDVEYTGRDGQKVKAARCGSPSLPENQYEDSRKLQSLEELRACLNRLNTEGITVEVVFHVIFSDEGKVIRGNVTDERISNQIDVLNADNVFAPHGFQFHLNQTRRYRNNTLYDDCVNQEPSMKDQYGLDPTTYLNVYTCSPSGLLGITYLPYVYDEESKQHGIIIVDESLPGGSAAPFNEGHTLTHEIGHYFGLFHTFTGGCFGNGDFVQSTPMEASPGYGCPVGRDTCENDPGLDPIHNFMDYSDDSCSYEFTAEQGRRMRNSACKYKFALVANSKPSGLQSKPPSQSPSEVPSLLPTRAPSALPTAFPSIHPSRSSSTTPTTSPSHETLEISTSYPSRAPTVFVSTEPSEGRRESPEPSLETTSLGTANTPPTASEQSRATPIPDSSNTPSPSLASATYKKNAIWLSLFPGMAMIML